MNVQDTVDWLKRQLESSSSADKLVTSIQERIGELRNSYRADRSGFTQDDIVFLRGLKGAEEQIKEFKQVEEEIALVDSLADCHEILERLSAFEPSLGSFAIGRRIRKEIRGLNERLPELRAREESRRRFITDARIYNSEAVPRLCSKGHHMVLREGTCGYFWGCGEYPQCQETRQLTSKQKMVVA